MRKRKRPKETVIKIQQRELFFLKKRNSKKEVVIKTGDSMLY